MVDLWTSLFVIGLLLGSTKFKKFNRTLTVWFKDIPYFDKLSIPAATALVIIGLLGILSGW